MSRLSKVKAARALAMYTMERITRLMDVLVGGTPEALKVEMHDGARGFGLDELPHGGLRSGAVLTGLSYAIALRLCLMSRDHEDPAAKIEEGLDVLAATVREVPFLEAMLKGASFEEALQDIDGCGTSIKMEVSDSPVSAERYESCFIEAGGESDDDYVRRLLEFNPDDVIGGEQ